MGSKSAVLCSTSCVFRFNSVSVNGCHGAASEAPASVELLVRSSLKKPGLGSWRVPDPGFM